MENGKWKIGASSRLLAFDFSFSIFHFPFSILFYNLSNPLRHAFVYPTMRLTTLLLVACMSLLGIQGCQNKVEELPSPDLIAAYQAKPIEIGTNGEFATVNLTELLSLKAGMRLVLGAAKHGTIQFDTTTGAFNYRHAKAENLGGASLTLVHDTIDYKVCQGATNCTPPSYITFRVKTADSCQLQRGVRRSIDALPGQRLVTHLKQMADFCPGTRFKLVSSGFSGTIHYSSFNNIGTDSTLFTLPPFEALSFDVVYLAKTSVDSVPVTLHINTRLTDPYCASKYHPRADLLYFVPRQTISFTVSNELFENDVQCPGDADPASFRVVGPRPKGYLTRNQQPGAPRDAYQYLGPPNSAPRDSLTYEIRTRSGVTDTVKLLFLKR